MDRRGRQPRTERLMFQVPQKYSVRAVSVGRAQEMRPVRPRQSSSSRLPAHQSDDSVKQILDHDRHGIVATANPGFGFVKVNPAEGKNMYAKNLFVHQSSLIGVTLSVGQRVKFDVAQGRKGFEAINVRMDTDAPAGDQSCSMNLSIDEVGERTDRRGEVISYDVVHRYGIVKCFGENPITLIAHHSRFKPPLTEIAVNQILKFNIVEGPKGPCADQIEIISDAATSDTEDVDDVVSSIAGIKLNQSTQRPDQKQTINDDFRCTICLEFPSPRDAVMTKCEHYFCKKHIERWLIERSRRCPNCSARVAVDDLKPLTRAERNLLETLNTEDNMS